MYSKISQESCETQGKILIPVDSTELSIKFKTPGSMRKLGISRLHVLRGQFSYWSTCNEVLAGAKHPKEVEDQPSSHGKREISLNYWINRVFLAVPCSRTPDNINIVYLKQGATCLPWSLQTKGVDAKVHVQFSSSTNELDENQS